MQNEKSFDTGELTLKYLESGAPGAPVFVGLHGLTSNKSAYSPLMDGLSKNWHVYLPDLRGHGSSGRAPDNRYSNADYARDVIAFLNFVGKPAVLMGHSLGAMAAIVVASQYPSLRAVILLDPPLSTYTEHIDPAVGPGQWFAMTASIMKDEPPYDTVVERLRTAMPGAPDEQITGTARFMSGVAAGTVETALRDEMWLGVDLPQALQQIKCPTLLIHGDFDKGGAMREQDITLFRTNCPSAQVVRIPGADHGLGIQQQPDEFLRYVNGFLASIG